MNGIHEFGEFVSAMISKHEISDIFVNDLMNQLIKEDDLRRTIKNNGNKSASGNTERRGFMIKDNKNSSNKKSSNKKNL